MFKVYLAIFGSLLLTSLPVAEVQAADTVSEKARPSALELAHFLDRLNKAASSHAKVTMEVKKPSYERKMSMESWSKGTDEFLVRILSPAQQAGQVTLKQKGRIWSYMPRLDRVIRLPSGVMGSSWMGSHFTYDDLSQATHYDKDYTLSYENEESGEEWILALVPKPTTPVVWSKLRFFIRASDQMPTRCDYLDEEGAVRRSLHFSDYRLVNGRKIPFLMELKPKNEEGYSRISYQEQEFDLELSDRMFSPQGLRKR
jgi:outer membrane lipoprotein-sorting protein